LVLLLVLASVLLALGVLLLLLVLPSLLSFAAAVGGVDNDGDDIPEISACASAAVDGDGDDEGSCVVDGGS
jgi:hypothetical protein